MRTRILPYVYDSVSVSEASEFNDLRVEGPRGSRDVGWKGTTSNLTRNNSLDNRALSIAALIVISKGDSAIFISSLQVRKIGASKSANGFLQVRNESFTRHRLLRL